MILLNYATKPPTRANTISLLTSPFERPIVPRASCIFLVSPLPDPKRSLRAPPPPNDVRISPPAHGGGGYLPRAEKYRNIEHYTNRRTLTAPQKKPYPPEKPTGTQPGAPGTHPLTSGRLPQHTWAKRRNASTLLSTHPSPPYITLTPTWIGGPSGTLAIPEAEKPLATSEQRK